MTKNNFKDYICRPYCLEEGLLKAHNEPPLIDVSIDQEINPSLRYLELHLLHGCKVQGLRLKINCKMQRADVAEVENSTLEFKKISI